MIRIPAVDSSINSLILQNKLSIRVQFREENLVGNVILGKKLNPVKVSSNSIQYSFSLILSKFILKYPAMITLDF